MSKLTTIAFMTALAGCASSQATHGTRPRDMSVAQHENAAANEEHAAQQEQDARVITTCAPIKSTGAATQSGMVCWASRSNPTSSEKADIAQHEKLAAEHRAAANTLIQAESQSCAGIDPEDRDVSLFFHREDIAAVEAAKEKSAPYFGNDAAPRTDGAVIVFRAVPGLTVEWLQHLVNCQMARSAALGYEVPEMDDSPLMLRHIQAVVTADGDKFRVAITSSDKATVKEIIRRAEALSPRPVTITPPSASPGPEPSH